MTHQRFSKTACSAALAFAVLVSAACGQVATDQPAPPPVAEAPAEAAPPPCPPVIDHRNWNATLASGATSTLTIEGQIDLPTPGYSVSLARPASEIAGATETTLTLRLAPPSGMVAQVVTPTPVYYFGPAASAYTIVHIACETGPLTEIPVTTAP